MREVDTAGLDRFTEDVAGAASRLPLETKRAEVRSAETVATAARRIAGQYSQKVAGTISVSTALGDSHVRAGGDAVPIAAIWEYGNKGGRRSPTFTHPVYGNQGVQVEQVRHPFMDPAIRESEPAMTAYADGAVNRAFVPYGLRPNT